MPLLIETGSITFFLFPMIRKKKRAPLFIHKGKKNLEKTLVPYRYFTITKRNISKAGIPGRNELATLIHDLNVLQKYSQMEVANKLQLSLLQVGKYLDYYKIHLNPEKGLAKVLHIQKRRRRREIPPPSPKVHCKPQPSQINHFNSS